MLAVADGKLDQVELKWDPRPALCVVATSKGYPGKYPTGVPITGIDDADAMRDVKVFHSGTAMQDGKTRHRRRPRAGRHRDRRHYRAGARSAPTTR